ncbi:MAG: hypothetical protein KUG75_05525 [Pseudomonadales bacterium]|nr:hypothetical protein [Pseudomonadales bacterium]
MRQTTFHLVISLTLSLVFCTAQAADTAWFEQLKGRADKEVLYRVLHDMPKGGDLHNHLSGAGFAEWWYEIALAQADRGYKYFTKVKIRNCREYGGNAFSIDPYFLMFRNIMAVEYEQLDTCEKGEYKALEDLDSNELRAWLNSIKLDKPYEGREEFFQTHWQRLNALAFNPWIQAELMYKNMQAFGDEGLSYIEFQVAVRGFRKPDGSIVSPEFTANILRERLQDKDALATGVTVRFQIALLRFLPRAEDALRDIYKFVHENSDLWVALNMVGREDNDKGHPRRFLKVMREMRRQYSDVNLSIHAGEVDEPNAHIKDTLLLGADRIGHGLNLISDDDIMRQMRHGPYLVEINLISNLLLEYISDYSQHPFPEYLRTGVPVALSTDDRGMWDSTLTDEFFVAVTEYDLSWDEVKLLSRNSLKYAFVAEDLKQRLLKEYNKRIQKFERRMDRSVLRGDMGNNLPGLSPMPSTRGFVCKRYTLCSAPVLN